MPGWNCSVLVCCEWCNDWVLSVWIPRKDRIYKLVWEPGFQTSRVFQVSCIMNIEFINHFWLLTDCYTTQNTHCCFSDTWNFHDEKEMISSQYNVTHGKKPMKKMFLFTKEFLTLEIKVWSMLMASSSTMSAQMPKQHGKYAALFPTSIPDLLIKEHLRPSYVP